MLLSKENGRAKSIGVYDEVILRLPPNFTGSRYWDGKIGKVVTLTHNEAGERIAEVDFYEDPPETVPPELPIFRYSIYRLQWLEKVRDQ